jgi:polyisoprenoid-binding protein YceI
MKSLVLVLSLVSAVSFAAVDLSKSEVKWKGEKIAAGGHEGTVTLKSADLVMEKDVVKSGTFVIDLNTIKTTDIKDDSAKKLEGHLKSADFFDVAKYPTATLVVKSATAKTVKADLTIKGKTQPVEFDVKNEGKALVGTLKFDRTKFDVRYASGNYFKDLAADKVIKDEIVLDFKIVQN